MSSAAPSEVQTPPVIGSKSKKNKKKKNNKTKANEESVRSNGAVNENDEERLELEVEEEEEIHTPAETPNTPLKSSHEGDSHIPNGSTQQNSADSRAALDVYVPEDSRNIERRKSQSKTASLSISKSGVQEETQASTEATTASDEIMNDIQRLQTQVASLERALSEQKDVYDRDTDDLRRQVEVTNEQKAQAETQYQNLLGKVNTIRSQLGERLKADAEDLAQARSRIEELEEQNSVLQEQQRAHSPELKAMAEDIDQKSKELSTLRNRTTLSQQNWSKEREDLLRAEKDAREEFEAAKQAMQEWEILAMEERSIRENASEKVADLEEQVASNHEAYEKAASERDAQSATVDGLQRALQEIQDARRQELREIVENSHSQVENLRQELHKVEAQAAISSTNFESTKVELERALPFEKEVKEKNLLIGKLRHEAVILNDHLTKALRYLKKGKPEDTIDKLLVTNHFMHFLALDRGDVKKFQILQIIAGLLGWTDEQREQAGLARPGASNLNAKIPMSPWHRTPSTPVLSTDYFPDNAGRKESLAELWSGFLEQQSQEDVATLKSPPSSSGGSKPP